MRRVVVVGSGMAASRLVERLLGAGTARDAGLEVTVVGDEPHPPYNRILLSAVLEGTHRVEAISLRPPGWYAERGVALLPGTRVAAIHREQREVQLVDDTTLAYDHLVLATGSVPTLPPIRGLVRPEGVLHERVHAFRTLADCTRLVEALPGARRVVVVGGGLLGLQVARALAVRGLDTEVVEGGEHLLRSQVGAGAGAALARDLRRLGTAVYTGVRAVRLVDDTVVLDNGATLGTDLVVVTAGGRPSVALARGAGLEVRRGVVVDDTLTTSDPAVHAIGDCAQPSGVRPTGLVQPAWEQADVLAARLLDPAGTATTYGGTRVVARLRATDLEVAVLGERDVAEQEGSQVVEVSNPVRGSYRRLVVRDGVVVGATLVGDLSRIGLITQHFDRRTRLGSHEPGALLVAERSTVGPAEHALPDAAEVCSCAGVSAGAVRACHSLESVRDTTRATTGCGGCAPTIRQLLATRGGTADLRGAHR